VGDLEVAVPVEVTEERVEWREGNWEEEEVEEPEAERGRESETIESGEETARL
jgi:hypothetical protein